MAAGDVTHDTHPVSMAGDHYIVTGNIQADTTARVFQLVNSQQALLYCNLQCTTDDLTTDTRMGLNVGANFSTATSGAIGVQAEAADTFNFTAGFK